MRKSTPVLSSHELQAAEQYIPFEKIFILMTFLMSNLIPFKH